MKHDFDHSTAARHTKGRKGRARHSASLPSLQAIHTHALTTEDSPHPPATGRQTLETSDCSNPSSYQPPIPGHQGRSTRMKEKESRQSPSPASPGHIIPGPSHSSTPRARCCSNGKLTSWAPSCLVFPVQLVVCLSPSPRSEFTSGRSKRQHQRQTLLCAFCFVRHLPLILVHAPGIAMDLNSIEIHHLVRVAVGCNSCTPPLPLPPPGPLCRPFPSHLQSAAAAPSCQTDNPGLQALTAQSPPRRPRHSFFFSGPPASNSCQLLTGCHITRLFLRPWSHLPLTTWLLYQGKTVEDQPPPGGIHHNIRHRMAPSGSRILLSLPNLRIPRPLLCLS
ncbi:hypothetical protein HDV57DRAFT_201497 [Trichoderma longibrachiatum]|uniref:Uncharacterized protein n=1 Tax=Trichoderma longibrachiatum ATCC 18648 TaxID=983965 RepID=A0A2T4C8E1_TRILO|nr:hypothetical protein M440DRAFT_1223612 [Trichoderma longibrachiatum ATCC 18648]